MSGKKDMVKFRLVGWDAELREHTLSKAQNWSLDSTNLEPELPVFRAFSSLTHGVPKRDTARDPGQVQTCRGTRVGLSLESLQHHPLPLGPIPNRQVSLPGFRSRIPQGS